MTPDLHFFWKYCSLSLHLSQRVYTLYHCHFDNNLAFIRPRYEGVISCKNLSHRYDTLNVTQVSFSLLSSKVTFFLFYSERLCHLSAPESSIWHHLCSSSCSGSPSAASLPPCDTAIMEQCRVIWGGPTSHFPTTAGENVFKTLLDSW